MSADGFDVRIRSVKGCEVIFDVLTGTAGGIDECCTSRSFAMFLFHDALKRAGDSLPPPYGDARSEKAAALRKRHDESKLGKALAAEPWYDAAWMRANVARFIAQSTLLERRNQLDHDTLSAREIEIASHFPEGFVMYRQHEWRPMRWEKCHNYTLRVLAADPAWTEHLEAALEFPTVGYDAWDESKPPQPPPLSTATQKSTKKKGAKKKSAKKKSAKKKKRANEKSANKKSASKKSSASKKNSAKTTKGTKKKRR